MFKVAIIGAGELGSRHLQGLVKSSLLLSIEILDNNKNSLEKAKKRAEEMHYNRNIISLKYITKIEQISCEIDLCIIATTANVRLEVLKNLISNIKVKNLILEKILFQKLSDFEAASDLLSKNKINTWVNCPRRLFPVYKDIKKLIRPNEKLTFTVIGGDWGLACNSIHFIDLLCFLNSNEEFEFQPSPFMEIVESKRKDYLELVGTLVGYQSNGSDIVLHSRKDNSTGLKIQILSKSYFWEVDEIKGEAYISSNNYSLDKEYSNFSIPYQSELTHLVCEDILLNGRSSLPSWETSVVLHKHLLTKLLEVFRNKIDASLDYCPIT